MSQPPAPTPLDPFRPPAAIDAGTSANAVVDDLPATSSRPVRVIVSVALLAVAASFLVLVGWAATAPRPIALAPSLRAAQPAPALLLTDQDGRPFSLTDFRGRPVLVFFGYTHCPDVCPATIGTVNEALAKVGPGVRVVFVSIDPERDTVAAMKAYLKYLPSAYTGLTGTSSEVRANADAWHVQYAKQLNTTGAYAMAHTADLFLVDAQGRIRTTFPFSTKSEPIAEALSGLLAETPPPSDAPATPPVAFASPSGASGSAASASPASPVAASPIAPSSQPATGTALVPLVVSSEIWAGGPDPVILTVTDTRGVPIDATTPIDVTVTGAGNAAAGSPVHAVAVQPWGEKTVYFVATVTIPSPGGWRLVLSTSSGASGSVDVTALDQGATTPLGGQAPNIHTPTLSDVGGLVRAVTTQPNPDLRLSQTSTSDARVQGRPYVIVIDSTRFRVSPLCGRAVVMVRYLLDRWQDQVAFIHLEPFVYTIVTEEPVLSGDIADPPLNQWAAAWGLGPEPWPANTVPWAFVVDGQGVVRAKYTGIIGSADLDVIISMIESNGVVAGQLIERTVPRVAACATVAG